MQIESKSKSKLVLTFSFVEMQPILREANVPKGELKTKQKLTKPPKAVVSGYWLLIRNRHQRQSRAIKNLKIIPVCGRGLAGMRLKETDEMLGIVEA